LQPAESAAATTADAASQRPLDAAASGKKSRKRKATKEASPASKTASAELAPAADTSRRKKRKAKRDAGIEPKLPSENQAAQPAVGTSAAEGSQGRGKKRKAEASKAPELAPSGPASAQEPGKKKRKGKSQGQAGGSAAQAPKAEGNNSAILDKVLQGKADAAQESDDDSLRGDDFVPTPGTQDREDNLKVFVGGLFWKLDAETVRQDFEECGPIESFDMPTGKSGEPMGVAFIVYKTMEGVENALAFDGDDYHGRPLRVKLSAPPPKNKGGASKGKGGGKGKGQGKGKGKSKGKGGGGGKGKSKG